MKNLVWFRRDLRVQDNRALFEATRAAPDGVIALYTITPQQWKQHDDAACKVRFWLDNVQLLSDALAKLNIALLIINADTFADLPEKIVALAKKHDCGSLFFNREYEVNEAQRDDSVSTACDRAHIALRRFHDRVIIPPREIATKDDRFYKVFTPYRKIWDTKLLDAVEVLPAPKKQKSLGIEADAVPTSLKGFESSADIDELWPAGEKEAARRLSNFADRITDYSSGRDLPAIDGTSTLSGYLAAGVISPRQCAAMALETSGGSINDEHEGARVWVSELAWRDFYTHVMVGFPRVSMHQPFKAKTEGIQWRDNKSDLEAWQEGRTGYPIVDAGMRQLNQTGWMHNRLRMVTAMFLTKHLLIDWRLGERYFMRNLIDGDLAANNGGWQWSASTGTDSVPYFRIFNPFSQSKRFDADGLFIKQMCPQLEELPAKALHDEKKLVKAIVTAGAEYPEYVVDYKAGRQRALAAFKSL
jgi:deoxyribodipyrimidine photo-lyase